MHNPHRTTVVHRVTLLMDDKLLYGYSVMLIAGQSAVRLLWVAVEFALGSALLSSSLRAAPVVNATEHPNAPGREALSLTKATPAEDQIRSSRAPSTDVPEPATFLLLGVGVTGLSFVLSRWKRSVR